jgi:hypothetical protein
VLVRAPVGFRHEHPILAQDCKLRRPFFHGLYIFDIACPCLNGRATPRWYGGHLEGIGQAFADQVDVVTTMNATAWGDAFAIKFYMPAAYSLGCTTACLEEAAIEEPAVDA